MMAETTTAIGPECTHIEFEIVSESWEIKALGSLLTNGRLGGNYQNREGDAEFPLMKMGNISRGRFNLSKVEFIAPGIRPDPEHRLIKGDVLFNTRNTLDLVGKVAIWRDELAQAYYNSNLMRLEFDPTKITNEYANLFLNAVGSIALLRTLATGTTSVAAIYTRDLLTLPFAVPPLTEQQAIAAALGDVDTLLDGIDRLIDKKRDLKLAAMQQLLTRQTRLSGFKGAWDLMHLGSFGECLRGVSYRGDGDLSPHDTISTKRLLRSNNVQNASIVTDEVQFVDSDCVSSRQLLKKNDILICMANGSKALVGKAGLFSLSDSYDYTFGAFMGCFRTYSADANPTFIFYLFQTTNYRDYISNLLAGSSINNLTPRSIESLIFSIPQLPEQTAIAAVLSEMDTELAALESRRDKTLALKQSMMQELLTGRIRLV